MAYIIDANIILHGRGEIDGELITVPEVYGEVKSQMGRFKIQNMGLSQQEPSGERIEEVKQKSGEINSPTSDTDEKLVALALEIDECLMTDDRALQNLALHLDADFEGFLDDPVRERREWKMICQNCGREVQGDKCECGSSSILRKPR